jgi:hypothetical protein
MKGLIRSVLIAAFMTTGIAFAHEGGEHIMGQVKSLDGSTLTVTTQDNKDVVVHVDEKTEFKKSGSPAKREELKSGEKVVVHAMKHGPMLHGTLVRFGKSASKAGAADAGTPKDTGAGHAH